MSSNSDLWEKMLTAGIGKKRNPRSSSVKEAPLVSMEELDDYAERVAGKTRSTIIFHSIDLFPGAAGKKPHHRRGRHQGGNHHHREAEQQQRRPDGFQPPGPPPPPPEGGSFLSPGGDNPSFGPPMPPSGPSSPFGVAEGRGSEPWDPPPPPPSMMRREGPPPLSPEKEALDVSSSEKRARVIEMKQKEREGREMAAVGAKMVERGMDKAISAQANAKAALSSLAKDEEKGRKGKDFSKHGIPLL